MSYKKIKHILNNIDEASLEQTIDNPVMKKRLLDTVFSLTMSESYGSLEDIFYMVEDTYLNDKYIDEIKQEILKVSPDADLEDIDYMSDLIKYRGNLKDTEVFRRMVREALEYKLDNLISYLQYQIRHKMGSDENYIELYRSVGISEIQNNYIKTYNKSGKTFSKDTSEIVNNYLIHLQESGKHLGIYWTVSAEKALEFGMANQSGELIILKTKLLPNQIDWYDTLLLRMDPILGEDEQEIRLFKNTNIVLSNVYWVGDYGYQVHKEIELDISSLSGKTFKA